MDDLKHLCEEELIERVEVGFNLLGFLNYATATHLVFELLFASTLLNFDKSLWRKFYICNLDIYLSISVTKTTSHLSTFQAKDSDYDIHVK